MNPVSPHALPQLPLASPPLPQESDFGDFFPEELRLEDLKTPKVASNFFEALENSKEKPKEEDHETRIREDLEQLFHNKSWVLLNNIAMEAIKQYPLNPTFYNYQGAALEKLGKIKEAKECYQASLNRTPNEDAYFSLARFFYDEKKWTKAAHAIHHAYECNPESKRVLTAITKFYKKVLEENNALEIMEKIIKKDPNCFAQENYALALIQSGKYVKAQEFCQSSDINKETILEALFYEVRLQQQRLVNLCRNLGSQQFIEYSSGTGTPIAGPSMGLGMGPGVSPSFSLAQSERPLEMKPDPGRFLAEVSALDRGQKRQERPDLSLKRAPDLDIKLDPDQNAGRKRRKKGY